MDFFKGLFIFLFICFIEVSLIYSVLVLGVQQSDLIIWVCVKEKKVKSLSRVQLFATPWTVACTRLLHPWDFLGKSTGVGCRFLLQGTSSNSCGTSGQSLSLSGPQSPPLQNYGLRLGLLTSLQALRFIPGSCSDLL